MNILKYIGFFMSLLFFFAFGYFTKVSEKCEPQIVEKRVVIKEVVEKEVEKKVVLEDTKTLCRYAKIYRSMYDVYILDIWDKNIISETGELLRMSDDLNAGICAK